MNSYFMKRRFPALLAAVVAGAALVPFLLFASSPHVSTSAPQYGQEKPKAVIEEDCQAFAIGHGNQIACAAPRLKDIKKITIERDDIFVASGDGKAKRIVDGSKFMPVPPPSSYIVESMSWSPDGRRLALNMTTMLASDEDEDARPTGTKSIALLNESGDEIKVAGSKTRFIDEAIHGAWLADGATVVYLTGGTPFQIVRVRPSDGQATTLFAGHSFDAVTWDTSRNQAFAVGENLSLSGRDVLVQLDLVHESVREITKLVGFQGRLSVSPSANKVGYFENGDTIVIVDLANPQKPKRIRAGIGRFEFGHDEKRVLLKRGPEQKSGNLVWVGIDDGSFQPILHDLMVHDFAISPDGRMLAVTDPGRKILKVYPIQ